MKNKVLRIIKYLILVIGALVTLIPFFWMLSTSFKTLGEVYQMPPGLLPNNFNFDNYRVVIEKTPMSTYLFNSVLVTTIVTVGTLVTSILAAFAFSRVKFKGRDIIFTILLSTMMVPSELLITPNFVILSKLNLINTLTALYLPWISSMFAIFLLRQYFLGIPEELYYAAKVDGCSDFKYLIKVMVPLTKPALITIALLKIVYSWNEFLWPMIMVSTPDKRTLPVGLAYFMTEAGPNYHLLLAYASIIIVPVIFIYLLLQKYIIQGITRSGIKG
ncbi:binding-protein-dependent transport systems inner membrane component [Alkaliphilus metalliredigens QYMF]|uniref:Binding-protein-dependent transport systems inner membrane component n=1 Tax=Alkaliphilus metalliredigens (strain QYMF) TaxID=293826 RepID=A6TNZ3_ALKMQ|nr:carbohydrate ABC transporter permease [Alkaliphilus metalliredigens]ABR47911.1 binding-protein-dependent transport systems inner membrane component [Alkaliphilus metalliredigens QYMF]